MTVSLARDRAHEASQHSRRKNPEVPDPGIMRVHGIETPALDSHGFM